MLSLHFLRCRQILSCKMINNYVLNYNFKASHFQSKHNVYTINTLLKGDHFSAEKISLRGMAGHAKWQNIQHIKAAKDREKTNICNKYVRLIGYAVKEGGPDPKLNKKLSDLLDEARRHNVAKDTLERALKKGSSKKTQFGTMEVLGPGGCMIIIEYETDSVSMCRHEIKAACKKYNANVLSGEGRWRAVFERKGIITCTKELSGKELDEAKALDSAIEAGAEEVHMKKNEEGENYLEFICAPEDLHAVKKELEKCYAIEEHYVAFMPIAKVQLSEEDMVTANNFLEELENVSDIARTFENIQ